MKRSLSCGVCALALLVCGCRFSVRPVFDDVGSPDLCGPGVPSATDGGADTSDLALAADLAAGSDLAPPPDAVPVFEALLAGSWAPPPAQVDLSADGGLDWAHWGLTPAARVDRKSGANLISNVVFVGNGATNAPHQYEDNHVAFSWSDGSPHGDASDTTTGVWISGIGNGVQLSVPAERTTRTLDLYISTHQAAGALVATLSEGGVASYTDTFSDHGTGTYRRYTFTYRSTGGQLLITWIQTESFVPDTSANITLQAVTLE
jgi:hypothetical protein